MLKHPTIGKFSIRICVDCVHRRHMLRSRFYVFTIEKPSLQQRFSSMILNFDLWRTCPRLGQDETMCQMSHQM